MASATAVAPTWWRWTAEALSAAGRSWPSSLKSRPVATRRPSRVTSRAVKEASWRAVTSTADRTVEKVASTPQ